MRFAPGSETPRKSLRHKPQQGTRAVLQHCCSHRAQLQTKQLTAGRTAPPQGVAARKLANHMTAATSGAAARDMSSPVAAEAAAAIVTGWRRPYSPGPLTEAEFEQYWQQGYVIKRGLLAQDDITPCLAAIERWDCTTPPSNTIKVLREHPLLTQASAMLSHNPKKTEEQVDVVVTADLHTYLLSCKPQMPHPHSSSCSPLVSPPFLSFPPPLHPTPSHTRHPAPPPPPSPSPSTPTPPPLPQASRPGGESAARCWADL